MGNICHKKVVSKVDEEMLKSNKEFKKLNENSDMININSTHFDIIKKLGSGSFGEVHMVKHKQSGQIYAMKVLLKEKIKKSDLVENSKVERIILSKLNFPFIVEFKYSFQSHSKLFIVTEYISGGDLNELLKKKKVFSSFMCKLYLAEIVLSLEYLHSNNCIYRDLKPENILLNEDGHIKIIDFNLSKLFLTSNITDNKAESICGTADYMAPEIIIQNEYDYLVDWYSLGVLAFVFHAGYTPFNCKKNPLDTSVKKQNIYFNEKLFSNEAKSLIAELLKYDSKERLGKRGVDEIKDHEYFADIDWDKVLKKEYKPDSLYIPNKATNECDEKLLNNDDTKNKESLCSYTQESFQTKGETYKGFTYMKDNPIP